MKAAHLCRLVWAQAGCDCGCLGLGNGSDGDVQGAAPGDAAGSCQELWDCAGAGGLAPRQLSQ